MKYVKECCRNTEGHPGPRFPISTSHGDVFHLKRKFQQKVWFKSVPTQPRTVCLDKHRSQMGEIVGVLEPRWGHLPLSVRVWGRYCCLKQPWMFALRLVHKREESQSLAKNQSCTFPWMKTAAQRPCWTHRECEVASRTESLSKLEIPSVTEDPQPKKKGLSTIKTHIKSWDVSMTYVVKPRIKSTEKCYSCAQYNNLQ